jgi:signal transduction histidine kinase
MPVDLEIPDGRFPARVEAAAYFVIAETLTNVARYADAAAARVTVTETGGRLVIVVADEGGGGADPAQGSGLRGLGDRVAAIGGTMDVSSPVGRGTTVTVELPLE